MGGFHLFHPVKFVTPLFGVLGSFGVFILASCCDSFDKFNTYISVQYEL